MKSILEDFSKYAKSIDKNYITKNIIADIEKWIKIMFEDNEEITLELLINTLDEQIYYYGIE